MNAVTITSNQSS